MPSKRSAASITSRKSSKQAIAEFEKALAIRLALDRKPEVAATQNNIGNAYYYLEQYETAIDFYQKAVAGFALNDDRLAIAETLNNTGSAHYSLGSYDAALDSYQQSLKHALEIHYRQGEATSLYGIGLVHYARGDYGLALETYAKNLALREFLRDRLGIATTLHSMGMAHLRQQNHALALAAYLKALPLYAEMGDRDGKISAAALLIEIGGIHFSQRTYEAAMERYRAALAAYQGLGEDLGVAAALNAIGSVYKAQKLFDPALEAFRKSLIEYERFGEKERAGEVLIHMAGAQYARGDAAQALKLAEQASASARQLSNGNLLWQARYIAGSVYRSLSQLDEARRAFEESIAAVEFLRAELIDDEQAIPFFPEKSAPYLAMMEWLLTQNRAVEAFAIAEVVRSQQLWDMLRGVRIRINKTMTAAEQDQQRQLHKALVSARRQHDREKARKNRDEPRFAALGARLQKARQDYNAFKTKLYAARPELSAWRGETPSFKPEEAQRLLDAKTAWLEFICGETQSYLFVLTRDPAAGRRDMVSVKAYILNVGRADLADRKAKFRDAIRQQRDDVTPAARDLYDLLIKPAAAQLAGKESLVIIPDPPLWGLPFQALQAVEGRYLLEGFSVVYSPSLLSLRESAVSRRGAMAPATNLTAFANPVFTKELVDRLKLSGREIRVAASASAEQEAKALAQLYGETSSRAYVAADASEDRLRSEAESSRLLHVSAPVLLRDTSPFYSSVMLSAGREDGLLQAWEIANLRLQAEAVVLTAAESDEGDLGDGIGVTGLAWSWSVAGSPALVVNQWQTEAGESDLLIDFHRHLKQRLAPAAALRQAALRAIMSDKSHPFHWSRFIVIKV